MDRLVLDGGGRRLATVFGAAVVVGTAVPRRPADRLAGVLGLGVVSPVLVIFGAAIPPVPADWLIFVIRLVAGAAILAGLRRLALRTAG